MQDTESPSAAVLETHLAEWAGIMATGRIETSPLGYLRALVNRFESGEFRLKYADEVAQIRSSTTTPPGA